MQPLHVIELAPLAGGRLVTCGVPGLVIAEGGGLGLCEPTLAREMARLADLRVGALVGLVEDAELDAIAYEDVADAARLAGVASLRLPLADFATPGPEEERAWAGVLELAEGLFRDGRGLALHCMAGLGRSGMMAACVLVHLGLAPAAALARLRAGQPEAIETERQLAYLMSRRPGAPRCPGTGGRR